MKVYNLLYKFINVFFGVLILRTVKTKYAIAIMKRIKLDVRYCWNFDRLYFLNKNKSNFTSNFLQLYYLVSPVGYGLSWGCAMESAYRIINIAYSKIYKNKNTIKYVEREKHFILNNLELHSNNNHIFFNIIGVLIANKISGNFTDDEKWKLAFINECQSQFNDDGTNFEASTNYHLVMMEAICHLINVRPEYLSLVKEYINIPGAIRFVNYIETNDGILLIGDNDDGMCIKNNTNEIKNRKSQIDFIKNTFSSSFDDKLPSSFAFKDFGVFFYRHKNCSISLWNPSSGQKGKSGHNHNDNHSICCVIEDKEFLIDPGVFYYSLKREYFRSEANHSTIISNKAGFNKFTGRFARSSDADCDLFYFNNKVKTKLHREGLMSDRSIELKENSFKVYDSIEVNEKLYTCLILSEFVSITKLKDGILLSRNDCSKKVYIKSECYDDILIEDVLISPCYGEVSVSNKVVLGSSKNTLTWEIILV
ncbi:hypothetical protein CGH37_11425 [Vibrio parahaemolyticus]|nr:heparinase II/III family protein [Vibrio parahaemolyticus]TOH60041.1 hypothetical protein CGI78_13335 [Vibrio parahaemolyticus]TOI22682.1 hypothetical protein CGI65_12255 [Vibrio parahaemolyticus]TOO36194.1 hypothetical protein CGH37_11425 [Vibrio parahaemolyticus]